MRIGILTYHRTVNEGSVLQAACLQGFLAARYPGADVEIVDYRPRRKEMTERVRFLSRRPPFIDLAYGAKLRQIREFVRDELRLSRERLVSNDGEAASRFIEKLGYDAVLVGSDTVWADQTKLSKLPAPNAYFLPGLDGPRRAGFAVSTDQSERRRWQDPAHAERLRVLIERFDAVTVRDDSTRVDLAALGVDVTRALWMPDPTLLHPLAPFAAEPSASVTSSSRPIAIVSLGDATLRRSASALLLARGFRPINLLGPRVEGQESLPNGISLAQRLGIYRHAHVVVTDRFHGSILALRLSPAVIVPVERASTYPDRPSKVRDLFKKLGLEHAVWRHESGPFDGRHLDVIREAPEAFAAARTTGMSTMLERAAPALRAIDAVVTGRGAS